MVEDIIGRENMSINQDIYRYSKKDFLLKIINSLEKEFEKILERGFDENSPFYEYIEDLRTVINKMEV